MGRGRGPREMGRGEVKGRRGRLTVGTLVSPTLREVTYISKLDFTLGKKSGKIGER